MYIWGGREWYLDPWRKTSLHTNTYIESIYPSILPLALVVPPTQLMSVAFVLPILQHDDEFATTDAENAVLSSVVFVGMLCGSYTWGGFSDVVGRRIVLITSLTVNGIFGAVSAFSPNIAMFIVCRFFSGIG